MKYLDFISLVEAAARKEKRILEFKRSRPWTDASFRIKLVKGILAMSNIKGGGRIVIGMEQQEDGSFMPKGMEENDFNSYKEEEVKDFVNDKYADPFADIDLEEVPDAPNKFIIISVRQFSEIPVICKRNYGNLLKKGGIYTRTLGRRPESALVSSQNEMREIIELAVDEGMKKLGQRDLERKTESILRKILDYRKILCQKI